jgi:hypothetical protein
MTTVHEPNHMKSFLTYANAFEVAYESDDWGVVDDLLADDISWVVEGVDEPNGGVRLSKRCDRAATRSIGDSTFGYQPQPRHRS